MIGESDFWFIRYDLMNCREGLSLWHLMKNWRSWAAFLWPQQLTCSKNSYQIKVSNNKQAFGDVWHCNYPIMSSTLVIIPHHYGRRWLQNALISRVWRELVKSWRTNNVLVVIVRSHLLWHPVPVWWCNVSVYGSISVWYINVLALYGQDADMIGKH